MNEKINAMSLSELEARAAEIDGTELSALNVDEITALNEERTAIAGKLAELRLLAAREAEKRDKVANNNNLGGKKMPNNEEEKRVYTLSSPEYRTAFFKLLQSREADRSDVAWTKEERDAYVTVTTDSTNHTGYLLPTETMNQIWDMIDEQHSILGDIEMYRNTGCSLEFPKRVSISQGDATTKNENQANDDEKNVWGQLVLGGKDFTKHIDISYKMMKMSIPAFEQYIVNEIAERLGSALASDVITTIGSGYDSTYNTVETSAVGVVAYRDLAVLLSKLGNRVGNAVFYASTATIYEQLVGMVDTTGRPIFQPSAQASEEGILVGKAVKAEDAITDGVIWVGYPKQIKGNMVQDIMIENDKNIKVHTYTYAGYCCFQCGLIAPDAFAKLTLKESNGET